MKKLIRTTYILLGLLAYCTTVYGETRSTPETILVWGDSLSAAYGMPVEQGWVALMQQELGQSVRVVNGSISGETTVGGKTRLPEALKNFSPDLVIIALGGNDGLRGMSPQNMRSNLIDMIRLSRDVQARVILVGIMLPPNYGPAYNSRFEQVFEDLAGEFELPYVPFLLEGVATDFDLMQSDGIHPTAEAQKLILSNMLPVVNKTLGN